MPRSLIGRLRQRAVRSFFMNFFSLLLIAISLSQWCILWWLAPRWVTALPPAAQLVAPAFIYVFNRWQVTRVQRQRRNRDPVTGLPRLYYAYAFTCLFGTTFLLLAGAGWVATRVFVGALAVQAGTSQAGLVVDSSIDSAFRWLANGGLCVIGVAFAYGYTIGQRRLRVRRLSLPLRAAPAALDGLRIAQISDIHIGQNLEIGQLEQFVAEVNALAADLVCITGDIIDAPSADVEAFLPVLARLRARHGVFAILGNHDHYAGADRVEVALRRLTPFTVLRDQRASVAIAGTQLHVIGLDDRGRDWARGVTTAPYLTTALAELPADGPVLLLCHRPDIFPHAAANGVGLTLSGHTHGGQLGVPWFGGRVRNLAEFITAFDRGLYERSGSYLYVNSGLGVTGQRIRLCTPREITVIEVRGGAAGQLAA